MFLSNHHAFAGYDDSCEQSLGTIRMILIHQAFQKAFGCQMKILWLFLTVVSLVRILKTCLESLKLEVSYN